MSVAVDALHIMYACEGLTELFEAKSVVVGSKVEVRRLSQVHRVVEQRRHNLLAELARVGRFKNKIFYGGDLLLGGLHPSSRVCGLKEQAIYANRIISAGQPPPFYLTK
jgi:hypothetical protein